MESEELSGNKTVALIVDDDRFMRVTLRQILEECGYAVIEADSGTAAIKRVCESAPDVVLLDIVMPVMDGFQTCAVLRGLPEGRHLPILMVTGLEDADTVNRAYAAGATDYIPKPINGSLLRHHLRYVLRASRLYGQLLQQKARLAEAQRIARLGNWELNGESRELFCSEETHAVLGLAPEQSSPTLAMFLERLHPDDRKPFRQSLETAMAEGTQFSIDHRIVLPDGEVRFVHTQAEAGRFQAVKAWHLTGTIQDISERKRAEEKLLLAGKVFDHSSEMILITGPDADIIDVNSAFCRLTGYGRQEMIGRNVRTHHALCDDEYFFRSIWDTVARFGSWQGELWYRRKDGESFLTLVAINSVIAEAEEISHYVVIATDISKQREAEQRLEHLAHFDPLTDLPNRLLFLDRLEQALLQAARTSELVALLFFDIDNFNEINETLGHQAGDEILRTLAQRVAGSVRRSDTVARFGSDEFAVILREVNQTESGGEVAQRVLNVLSPPFAIDGKELYLTVSIGITFYPDDGGEAEELAKKAETAMHFAKQQGKGCYQFFSAEMNTRARERLVVKSGLHRALERKEFILHYQPKFDSHSRALAGLEALVRWRHPERGLIPPLRFIPLAEETGLIIPLGEQVLRMACRQNMEWREQGFAPFRVAVNLSACQFRDRLLVETVRQVLDETGLPPDGLELEITESALMQDTARATEVLRRFRDMGIRIALDDFGTGYSSLSYLKRFPVDILKIDHSFVRNMFINVEDAAIVRSIIAIAKSLKMRVIAEGVEQEEELCFLRDQGCDEVQGYPAGMPEPAEKIEQFLVK